MLPGVVDDLANVDRDEGRIAGAGGGLAGECSAERGAGGFGNEVRAEWFGDRDGLRRRVMGDLEVAEDDVHMRPSGQRVAQGQLVTRRCRGRDARVGLLAQQRWQVGVVAGHVQPGDVGVQPIHLERDRVVCSVGLATV